MTGQRGFSDAAEAGDTGDAADLLTLIAEENRLQTQQLLGSPRERRNIQLRQDEWNRPRRSGARQEDRREDLARSIAADSFRFDSQPETVIRRHEQRGRPVAIEPV